MPSTPPNCCIVFKMPAALPSEAEGSDATRDAHHRPPPLGWEGRGQQGETQGHDDGCADALDSPTTDQGARVGGQGAGRRCRSENCQAEDAQAQSSEPLAQGRGGDDPGAEGHLVGVDRPLKGPISLV
jgi:hypothetical protein